MTDVTRAHVDIRADATSVRATLTGEIDLSNAATIQAQLFSAITNETDDVELDLTGVTYLDSAGLRVVYALTTRLRLSQTGLRIVAPPESPARFAIEVSGMATLCPLDPPPEE